MKDKIYVLYTGHPNTQSSWEFMHSVVFRVLATCFSILLFLIIAATMFACSPWKGSDVV